MTERTVLVVDDDPSIRLLCRVNLELDGLRVLEADCLANARAALAAEPVQTVLLDLHVGGDDGLELLQELRRERPSVSVVLVTGASDVDGAARSADAVLGKPFELDDLRVTVQALASGRARRS